MIFSSVSRIASRRTVRRQALSSAAGVVLAIAAFGGAQAQDQQGAVEAIVVTGSRITTPGFEAPTPLTSISQQQIQLTGALGANALQYQVPALVPNISFQLNGGNPGQSNFNLRSLGTNRTLLLLDGRRVMPTSYDGTTDGNIIPVSLIKRVDVVTGGASAAYGSDAVAGVVNLILDNDFVGVKGNMQFGETEVHDNVERDISITAGTTFAGGKGHIVVSGELYDNSGGAHGARRRPWAQEQWALIPNPLYVAGSNNGQPRQLVLPGVTLPQVTDGGVVTSGPLRGVMFGPGGIPSNLTFGQYVGTTFMQGGNGASFSPNNSMSPALNRKSFYTHVSYDFSDAITAWGEVMLVDAYAESPVTPNYDNGGITARIDNPYLPAATRAQMQAAGVTTLALGRANYELGYNDAVGTYKNYKFDAGLKGKFGGGWTWDLSGQYGINNYRFDSLNNRNTALWTQAIDVVSNPANGQPICRSTLTNPSNGCVPINVFGPNAISPAGVAYVSGTSWNYYPQRFWDAAFNVQGTPFKTWAGPVAVAFGGEARRNSVRGTADPISIARGWRVNNTQPISASQSVKEGYIETDIPLLADKWYAKDLSFNGAFRLTNYATSGTVKTWKLGFNYTVNDDIRLRGTNSRDIRAPTLNELYAGAGASAQQIIDRTTNRGTTINSGTGGNPDLIPETATTNTIGVVFSPKFLSGFQASIDYYKINIKDAISSPGVQGVIDLCQIYGQANLCQYVTRSPTTGLITAVLNTPYNASVVKTAGIDFEVSYRSPVDRFINGAPGTINIRAVATHVDKFLTTNVGSTTDSAGTGNNPKWRGSINATYTTDKLAVNFIYRYTAPLVYDNAYVEGVDINTNHIASRSYFDIGAEYRVNDHWRLFGKVANLFDTNPPVGTEGNIAPRVQVSQAYDNLGRRYTVGLRFAY